MSHSEPRELIQAKQLMEEGKLEEALQLVDDFGKKDNLSYHDQISYYILKSSLSSYFFNKNESLEYAERAYKESQKLENSLQLLDVYIQMAAALLQNNKTDESDGFIEKSEDLLKLLIQEPSSELMKRKAFLAYMKSYYYERKSELEKALECAEYSLALREELSLELDIIFSLHQIGWHYFFKGDLDSALKYAESSKALTEKIKYKLQIQDYNWLIGAIFRHKGELDRALSSYKQALAIAEDLNNNQVIPLLLNSIGLTYHQKGDFNRALENLEKSLVMIEEISENNQLKSIISVLDSLFHLTLDMNDLKKAEQYFNRIKQINDQEEDKFFNYIYRIDSAEYLKKSPRALNRGKAEEILKQVVEEEILNYELFVIALLNLCDLLLFELRATGEPEILDELQSYISRLFDTVRNARSYSLLAETYLLQARLALLTLDINRARKFFSKSQDLAEKYGLNRLAVRISIEHDEFLNQIDQWENLRESKASLEERIKLSGLNDQVVQMLRKREVEHPKLIAEQPVLFAIMTKEGDVVLSSPFTADMTIDDTQFGEFLSSCNAFCDQIFSESFDRVKFGRYTILITALDSFCVYYMFQGHSYSAQQKLNHFIEAVKKDPPSMKVLENAVNVNKVIQVNDYPSLEELITESFLSDPQKFQMPFKAYDGDGSFLFVSYSHTDRLQVYPIIDYLNKTGLNIWYDEGIPVSEDWKKSIVENLDRCRTFLVFITPHIIDSDYVRKEISFALKKKKKFFAVYLKETELPNELEFEIADIQSMKKYLIPETEFYNKLREMLHPELYE